METHPPSAVEIDLRELIGHRETVAADCPLEFVHKQFGTHQHEFMAVLDGTDVLGVCSRHEIGMRLGARYGFALFSRKPIRDFLSAAPMLVRVDQPIAEVLETVFARANETFYDDIVLLGTDGAFLGLIYVHTLVRIQAEFLRENIRLLEEQKRVIHEKNQQMEEDLAMAHEVQLAILPEPQLCFPAGDSEEARMHFARLYRPAQKVGGDFVHVVEISDHELGIFIADVMGHGVRSALITAMLRALVEEIGCAGADPGQLLTQLNRDLAAILRQAGELMFVTAFYLVADDHARTFRYACAGHPHPVRIRAGSGLVDVMHCARGIAGPGLCVWEDAVYGTAEAAMEPGDTILLYTDGLIEASDPDGELFGIERLQQALPRLAPLDVPELVEAIFAEAGHFARGVPFEDDICIAGLSVAPRAQLAAAPAAACEIPAGA